jgi:hypothetical protein
VLKFDEERQKESVRHNLSSLYGVERAPCDTQLREILDPVNPGQLWPAYTALFAQLQRGKGLRLTPIWEAIISRLRNDD